MADRRSSVAGAAHAARLRLARFRRDWRRSRVGRKSRGGTVTMLTASLLLLVAVFGLCLAFLSPKSSGERLTLDEIAVLARQHRIDRATFEDEDAQLRGTYLAPDPAVAIGATPPRLLAAPFDRKGSFTLAYQKSDAVTAQLSQALVDGGGTVVVDKQVDKARVRLVTTFLLPLVILANLFTLLFSVTRGSGGAIGEVINFGSMGKRRHRGQARPVTFADVAGADEAVAELREVRDYLADPSRYEEVGAQPPKGVLLFGPPGCGKTLLAKAVAGEAGVPFFSVAGAEFVESLVGVGAARVRDLFQRVRAVAPAIVFIDELDAAGRKRGSGSGGGGSDEREQTLNQLLVEMDGFDVSSGIVVMAATNRPDIIDPALMRPGRFDRHITIDHPDAHGRIQILALHAFGKPLGPDVDFDELGRRTAGFTGADLANVVNEAALLAVREARTELDMPHFEEAVQRVISGPQRRGRVLSSEERKRLAYHESGHAILAAVGGRHTDVHRVSILARSRSLATTTTSGDQDAALLTFSQLKNQLVVAFGGIVAEELVFGEPSTGAEEDLERASGLASDMVSRYGMTTRLGRRRLVGSDADVFLGGAAGSLSLSGHTQQEMDGEIVRFLADAEETATDLLVRHRDVLDLLAERLEVEETLEGVDLESLLSLVVPEVAELGGDLAPTTRTTVHA
ncbi:MAG: cell division protease FtsH [Frankiaceae bacterium]|jgi:cell division protease FtsH|nr:cell division protease FtsH [Frankiaceae bacterium]